MKYFTIPLFVLMALAATSWTITTAPVAQAAVLQDQNTSNALERGYRTGYSDGFSAGSRDIADHAPREYRSNEDYQRANRNYNETWGALEEYRDGYQQGFEAGYNAGYEQRSFDSSIPAGLTRRGARDPGVSGTNEQIDNQGQTNNGPVSGPTNVPQVIPRDSILLVEMETSLSTDATQRGDHFQARVIEPREFAGAMIDGRVTRVKRAGKVKGTSEMQLSFETIRMPDGSTSGFNAEVVELVDMNHRDDGGTVDSEGGVKGRSSTKDDISRVGASTGIGAVIGAVLGGGKGAAIGAAIGGAVGTSSVLTQRGHDVRLERGQQMRIRTATEARVQ